MGYRDAKTVSWQRDEQEVLWTFDGARQRVEEMLSVWSCPNGAPSVYLVEVTGGTVRTSQAINRVLESCFGKSERAYPCWGWILQAPPSSEI